MGNMTDETSNSDQNEQIENNLTPNTDERKVSKRQLARWKGEGGALPADFDPDTAKDDSEQ
ncbi:hypothetical protein GCM10025778_36480 [Paeniglutamicibacter antarcticus]|uniref:Uncharacterized protein n=2 Tax=Paeniglutamicibacter antarcticus TaxID=494023 RepID=A0ABP9TQU1_9MICC